MKYNPHQSSAFSSSSNHATQSTHRSSSITNHDQSNWYRNPLYAFLKNLIHSDFLNRNLNILKNQGVMDSNTELSAG